MPKLLDTRLIGRDLADVTSRDYNNATPGQLLQVGSDGMSMVLGAGSDYSYLSSDAESERSGISIQQFLCRTWRDITPSVGTPFANIFGTAYGIGIFWAVGVDTLGNAKIVSSYVDAITGSSTIETTFFDAFTISGGIQVNAGSLTPSPFLGPVYDVKYGNGIVLACGANGRIGVLGSNGWEPCVVPAAASAYNLYRLSYGHRKGWVAVGTETTNTFGPGVTLFSEDGINWSIGTPALGVGVPVYGVAYGGSFYGEQLFVAVGGVTNIATNHIATSKDGKTWTIVPTHASRADRAHYSVAFGNGVWMIGTQQAGTGPTASSLLYSTTTFEWAPVTGVSGGNLQTISYGNGMFICASTLVYGSLNGSDSGLLYTPTPAWTASAGASCYGNGIFLVGSRDGKLIRSSVINEVGLGAPGPAGPAGAVGPAGPAGAPGGLTVTEFGAVGSYTIATMQWPFPFDPLNPLANTIIPPNGTVPGSYLFVYANWGFQTPYERLSPTNNYNNSPPIADRITLSGTWRNMGGTASTGYIEIMGDPTTIATYGTTSLWQRVS